MLAKVTLEAAFASFTDHWSPRIAGQVNDCLVKLVKLKGPFLWHHHEHEDEMFLVVKGRLVMHLRDGEVTVNPGEFIIVPRAVEHMPVADEETHILLFEPGSTLNTGNVRNDRTIDTLGHV